MDRIVLKSLGLTDIEIQIFLTLLKNDSLSVYEISRKAGLYRQATYDSLKRLMEKGFVSSVTKDKSKLFKAVDPKIILDFL